MKKHPLLFSALTITGIILFLGSCKTSNTEASNSNKVSDTSVSADAGIVYVNIDTVLSKFDMYNDIMDDLNSKLQESQAKLASKENAYKKGVQDYQYKAQRGLVTRSEAAEIEQNLGSQQQELMQLQNQLQNDLQEQSAVAQRKVLDYIMVYLKEVKSIHGYKYVLGASFGGNILYADENLNITNTVIEGLNKKYQAEKGKSK